MKRFINLLPLIAGAIALSACSEIISSIEEETYDGAQLMTITASQEGDDTRAAIDATVSSMIDWSKNDKINYYGAGKDEFMTLDGDGGSSSGSFTGKITPYADGSNYVLYPYNSTATCNRNTGNIATTVPSVQHVPAGSFDPKCAIMVGKVEGTSVQFKNAVAFLALTIPFPKDGEDWKINKMVITGNDNEYLWGDISIQGITADAAPATITWKSNGNKYKYIEVLPEGSATFEHGKTYYVAINPNASLSKGLYILFYDGSTEDPKNLKLTVKKTNSNIGIARNKVKKIQLPTIEQSYFRPTIELTAENGTDKVYMSPLNLGAQQSVEDYVAWKTDLPQPYYQSAYETTYGNYYTWGEIDTRSDYSRTSKVSESSFQDAATANWGPDWRMPTYKELEKNLDNEHIKLLPCSGYYEGKELKESAVPDPSVVTNHVVGYGFYWTADYDANYGTYCNYLAVSTILYVSTKTLVPQAATLHSIRSDGYKGTEGMNIVPVLK